MSAQQLSCENCGGPLSYGAQFCAYCRRPLQWGRHIAIERGEQFFVKDFSRDPVPGSSIAQKRTDGALIHVEKENWERWGSFEPKLRNACIAVRGAGCGAPFSRVTSRLTRNIRMPGSAALEDRDARPWQACGPATTNADDICHRPAHANAMSE